MNKSNKVSVALCTYYGARYLREQLESIAAQTQQPDELVVCDDGSKDETVNILVEFSEKVPFAVRIYQNDHNLGSTKNYEKAIRLCGGKIIALSDQDDVWLPEKLEKLTNRLESDDETMLVFSDAEVVDENLKFLSYGLWDAGNVQFSNKLKRQFSDVGPLDVLIQRNVITGATMAFKMGLREYVLPIDENWVHDGWIAAVAAALGKKAAYVDERLILYRQHSNQQIGASPPVRKIGLIKAVTGFIMRRLAALKTKTGLERFVFDTRDFGVLVDTVKMFSIRHGGSVDLERNIERIEGKIRHQKAQERILSRRRLFRAWPILLELVKGNYSRYSSSVLIQCGKDLLR